MRRPRIAVFLAFLAMLASAFAAKGLPEAPRWPLTLREGLPEAIPGWAGAPRDALPEEDENAMGHYVEVSRFFQKIESPTSTKQFRLAVQDYGAGKDLLASLRQAVAEAAAHGVETRTFDIAGHAAFVVTDHSTGKPTTMVTVVVSPGRLLLGQGANVPGDEAVKLVRAADLGKLAAVRDSAEKH
ncbi:MAG: hypothetical protein ABI592_02990 [Acidobacteriota bacterium]